MAAAIAHWQRFSVVVWFANQDLICSFELVTYGCRGLERQIPDPRHSQVIGATWLPSSLRSARHNRFRALPIDSIAALRCQPLAKRLCVSCPPAPGCRCSVLISARRASSPRPTRVSYRSCPAIWPADWRQPGGVQVFPGDYGLTYFAMPFQASGNAAWFAVGYVLNRPDARPRELVLAAVDRGWDESSWPAFLTQMPYCHHQFLEQHLNLAWRTDRQAAVLDDPGTSGCRYARAAVEHTHEIGLLHSLTQNMQISHGPSRTGRTRCSSGCLA